jgi:hypothetical protein
MKRIKRTHMLGRTLGVFDYCADLDCFVVSEMYRQIADELGLSEWHPAVWIGRLFMLDNDCGEHWLDNWHLREQLESAAIKDMCPFPNHTPTV